MRSIHNSSHDSRTMKTKLSTGSRSLRKMHAAIVAATLVVSGGATVSRGGAFDSPTGVTYDCVISGVRNGLAYLTFVSTTPTGGTFSGHEIVVPRLKSAPSINSRGGGDNDERTPPEGSGTVDTNQAPQIHGDVPISGNWSFDTQGRVIGFFTEDGTNSVGFKATVTPAADPLNNRINLIVSTGFGKANYHGRTASLLSGNYTGDWNGFKQQHNQTFIEIFNMTLSGGPGPNFYTVSGNGGGYSYSGVAIISNQKKIAFSLGITPGTSVRATFGSFNLLSATGNTKGWDQPGGILANPATFKVEQQKLP